MPESAKRGEIDGIFVTSADRISRKLEDFTTFYYKVNELGVKLLDIIIGMFVLDFKESKSC
jgi:DNA invertase Pin-like site-specific DNA recombinase